MHTPRFAGAIEVSSDEVENRLGEVVGMAQDSLVPGADQASLPAGSIDLGELKGNIGDQNYDLPPGTELAPGAYTALVWCEAFSVEFVGATITI